jgi:hypothetical protein
MVGKGFECFRFQEGEDFELPEGWQKEILRVANEFSNAVKSSEPNSTSVVERDDTYHLNYSVTTGDIIRDELPWLFDAYSNALFALARGCWSAPLCCSPFEVSAVNLNVMRGVDATYEWHVDSNPLTGLLFATSHPEGTGGQLVFDESGSRTTVFPRAGEFLLFDAREVPHVVQPLLNNDTVRVSAPMNYYEEGKGIIRPDDLDAAIYGASAGSPEEINE